MVKSYSELSKKTDLPSCLVESPKSDPRHFFPAGLSDDLLSRKCQDFNLSDELCSCLKDRESNSELKSALNACKDEGRKAETDTSKKSKRQAEPEEPSEHSQVRATPSPQQHQINKECVVAALNSHCSKQTTAASNSVNPGASSSSGSN